MLWQILRIKSIFLPDELDDMARNDQLSFIKLEELYQNLRFNRFMLDFAY